MTADRFCREHDELRNFFRSRSRHNQYVSATRRRRRFLDRGADRSGFRTTRTDSEIQQVERLGVPDYSEARALQVSFSKRFSRGFQFEGSYTWAKAIQEGLSHPNSYNILMSRSLADYDIAHRFVISYIYELPFGKGRPFGSSWR